MKEVSTEKKIKVHSLIDKVYSLTNLKIAWEKVKANKFFTQKTKKFAKNIEKKAHIFYNYYSIHTKYGSVKESMKKIF